ncbi:hypothetical protein CU098_001196, partial [Rhizopus stolonifer]
SHKKESKHQSYEEKRNFTEFFNRFYEPIDVQLKICDNSERLHAQNIQSIDLDTKMKPIDHAIQFDVIQPNDIIQSIDDWIMKSAGIDKELSDKLLKVYFTNIHHYIPVVNKKAFLEEYRGIRPNFPFGILLVSMYLASVNYITICQKFGDADCLNNGKPLNLPKDLQKNLECQFSKYLGKKYEPSLPF